MTMDPRHFTHIARSIPSLRCNEQARCRSAVNRAYYGAFNAAADALLDIGINVGDGPQAHANTYRFLQKSGDVDLRTAGGELYDLSKLRRIADYEMGPRPEVEAEKSSEMAVELSGKIIREIDALLGDTKRIQAVASALTVSTKVYGQIKGRRSRQ